MRPLVIGYHLVWTTYGSWLPNDPRGSMSRFLASDVLGDLGELHYGRKQVQPASREIRAFYEHATPRLKHEVLTLSEREIDEAGASFADVIARERYTCYACAILPDHVHLLVRKHRHLAEDMIWHLQNESRSRLRASGFRSADHPTGGGPGWKVFLDEPDDVWRTIRYVASNLTKARRTQAWSFVTPYNNWPLHEGHSPDSPYARRLRERGRRG
jgi:REP element-mobilizing transposase RayT